MQETNDSLEQFFKSRAENADIPFQPSHWEMLEPKVIRFNRWVFFLRWSGISLGILFFVIAPLFYYLGWLQGINKVNTASSQASSSYHNESQIPVISNEQFVDSLHLHEKSVFLFQKPIELDMRIADHFGVSLQKGNSNDQHEQIFQNNAPVFLPDYLDLVTIDSLDLKMTPLVYTLVHDPDTLLYNHIKQSIISPKWLVSVGFSTDFSSVHARKGFENPNFTGLVGIQYFFGKKWSISTGLGYTSKTYAATPDDYAVPKGFWTYGIKPSEIDATCQVFEWPVLIHYNFWRKNGRLFQIKSGLSSYWMQREYYDYQYVINESSINPIDSWEGFNRNKHYFSILHTSVFLGRTSSTGWTYGIEPFYKIPLKGIGFGNVSLYSRGIFFHYGKTFHYKSLQKSLQIK